LPIKSGLSPVNKQRISCVDFCPLVWKSTSKPWVFTKRSERDEGKLNRYSLDNTEVRTWL